MKRQTPAQMFKDVKERLTVIHRNYRFKPHDWFRPDDVAPHSLHFKYICKRLYSLGLLEGCRGDRWGWSYRVPKAT